MSLTLVIDLNTVGKNIGKTHGCLLIEQFSIYAYLVGSLDYNIHGQLRLYQSWNHRHLFGGAEMAKQGLQMDTFCADTGAFLYSSMLHTRPNGIHTS